jgi:hypothetical protein
MREDDIRRAIENLPGEIFEPFAVEMVSRVLYPGLNPTSSGYDFGEDARTEPSVEYLLPDGIRVSVVASKTCKWNKLRVDCQKCQKNGRDMDILVYVTTGTAASPRESTIKRWAKDVKKEFGWDLEVRLLRWLAPVASRPEHESFVDDRLGIPPPGGDFVQNIKTQFSSYTRRALRQIRLRIPGIPDPLPREEIERIEEQLHQRKAIILTGEAGTGKSGIGYELINSATESGMVGFLLDARQVGHIRSPDELRQYFGLNGPLEAAIARVGRFKQCRLIIDQLDNIAMFPSANLLVDLAIDCYGSEGVEIVIISRKREGYEADLLNRLTAVPGFVELSSYPLSEDAAIEALSKLGIIQPPPPLIELSCNLLNLELIGAIGQHQSLFDFTALLDEVDLWEQYMNVLQEREQVGATLYQAQEIIAEAVRLAQEGLNSADGTFQLNSPPSQSQNRLNSWGIIVQEEGRIYRFRHEKLQDFLYAQGATERVAMPEIVVREINSFRTRNVMVWMFKIYTRHNSPLRIQFLRQVLDV